MRYVFRITHANTGSFLNLYSYNCQVGACLKTIRKSLNWA